MRWTSKNEQELARETRGSGELFPGKTTGTETGYSLQQSPLLWVSDLYLLNITGYCSQLISNKSFFMFLPFYFWPHQEFVSLSKLSTIHLRIAWSAKGKIIKTFTFLSFNNNACRTEPIGWVEKARRDHWKYNYINEDVSLWQKKNKIKEFIIYILKRF